MSTFTDHDMRNQVSAALDSEVGDFDVTAIVDTLQAKYGTVPIKTIEGEDFWHIVSLHQQS